MPRLIVVASSLTLAAIIGFVPLTPTNAQNRPRVQPFIVGGTVADIKDFPYQVALIFTWGNDTFQCGGSIIASEWVLTAAHCFYDDAGTPHMSPGDVEIRYGDSNLWSDQMTVKKASAFVLHPKYVHGGEAPHDIALVKVEGTNALPRSRVILLDGEQAPSGDAIVSGWGKTQYRGSTTTVLMKATVPLVSNERCNKLESYGGKVGQGMICAGFAQGGASICSGDSGGALVQVRSNVRYQVGIVSWQQLCGAANKFGVYTRVSYYRDFIQSTISPRPSPPFVDRD